MNRIFKIFIAILVISSLMLSLNCSSSTATSSRPPSSPGIAPAPAADYGKLTQGANSATSESAAGYGTIAVTDRKIVKTGYMTLTVNNIVETLNKITAITQELEGYVVSSNKSEGAEFITGRAAIRVPAARYDEAVNRLRQLATKVPYEKTDSQDVTEEYMDLQARLNNLEATEKQYLVLLNKALTVQDILDVQRELSNVRQQIEQTKGRIQYLDRTTNMSLIDITLQEAKSLSENGWNASDTLITAVNGLITFGKILVNILIWLLIFSPLWLIIIGIIFLVRRKKRKAKL